jgi:serine protease
VAAPDATAVEPGKVLVKLTQSASVQARNAEIGGDNIVAAGIPSLDQRLREIGASDLQPLLEEVADAIPDESLDSLSAQAVTVGQLYSVSFPADQSPAEVAAKLQQDPTVEYAEPAYIAGITAQPRYVPLALTPNDPLFSFQWNLQAVQMPAAWDMATGQAVTVAIVDTGVDFKAPDLANTQHLQGYDFFNNDGDPTDDQGHGTHVAGTVAQSTNNGLGVAGVAYNAQILPVKVLGANGQGSYENIIKGIVYAVGQGAKVINMSLAGRTSSQGLLDAVKYAQSKGVVVVAAAGNSAGPVEYPAAYDDYVLGVGALRFDKTRPTFSNFGPQIDLMAPGGDLDVDQNGDGYADGILQQTFKSNGSYTYLFFEGTSMASPHVAGLAALILSKDPSLSPTKVENIMAQTAQNLGSPEQMGAGLIQAASALNAVGGQVIPTPVTPTFTPSPLPTTPSPPTATFTPMPPLTPTVTVMPVCTPPACQPGEVLYCPSGDCPQGCGIQCATPTPQAPTVTPVISPTPTFTPIPQITVTPTTAPPVTPAPAVAGELLLNPGFETDYNWVFGDTPIRGGYDTTVKLSGNRAVRLGNVSGPDSYSYSSVWQRVTIPATANQVTLRVNVYPTTQDTPGSGDVQTIMLLNERFRVIRFLSQELSNSRTWEARSYNLSDFKGQTIYVYFGVVNVGGTGKPTALYVDDVSLTGN